MNAPTVQDEAAVLAREFESGFSGKRTLVTGGAGFIGSWLCDVLVLAGGTVDCLDTFSTCGLSNIEYLK